jgi:hypothetical protein
MVDVRRGVGGGSMRTVGEVLMVLLRRRRTCSDGAESLEGERRVVAAVRVTIVRGSTAVPWVDLRRDGEGGFPGELNGGGRGGERESCRVGVRRGLSGRRLVVHDGGGFDVARERKGRE